MSDNGDTPRPAIGGAEPVSRPATVSNPIWVGSYAFDADHTAVAMLADPVAIAALREPTEGASAMGSTGDGQTGEPGGGQGKPPFEDRMLAGLMGLGEGLSTLNNRLDNLNSFTSAHALNAIEGFRDLAARVTELENIVSDLIRALSSGSPTQN